jgi:hypothetical protein
MPWRLSKKRFDERYAHEQLSGIFFARAKKKLVAMEMIF